MRMIATATAMVAGLKGMMVVVVCVSGIFSTGLKYMRPVMTFWESTMFPDVPYSPMRRKPVAPLGLMAVKSISPVSTPVVAV